MADPTTIIEEDPDFRFYPFSVFLHSIIFNHIFSSGSIKILNVLSSIDDDAIEASLHSYGTVERIVRHHGNFLTWEYILVQFSDKEAARTILDSQRIVCFLSFCPIIIFFLLYFPSILVKCLFMYNHFGETKQL